MPPRSNRLGDRLDRLGAVELFLKIVGQPAHPRAFDAQGQVRFQVVGDADLHEPHPLTSTFNGNSVGGASTCPLCSPEWLPPHPFEVQPPSSVSGDSL